MAPVWPPEIRLPGSTLRSERRPLSGAVTTVHSRLSSALRSADSADLSWARDGGWTSACRFPIGDGARPIRLGAALGLGSRADQRAVRPLGRGHSAASRTVLVDVNRIAGVTPAVVEVLLVDEARDAGTHLDRGDGLETSGIFVPLGDALGQGFGNRHRHGRRRTALGPGLHRKKQKTGDRGEVATAYGQARTPPRHSASRGGDVVALQVSVNRPQGNRTAMVSLKDASESDVSAVFSGRGPPSHQIHLLVALLRQAYPSAVLQGGKQWPSSN